MMESGRIGKAIASSLLGCAGQGSSAAHNSRRARFTAGYFFGFGITVPILFSSFATSASIKPRTTSLMSVPLREQITFSLVWSSSVKIMLKRFTY